MKTITILSSILVSSFIVNQSLAQGFSPKANFQERLDSDPCGLASDKLSELLEENKESLAPLLPSKRKMAKELLQVVRQGMTSDAALTFLMKQLNEVGSNIEKGLKVPTSSAGGKSSDLLLQLQKQGMNINVALQDSVLASLKLGLTQQGVPQGALMTNIGILEQVPSTLNTSTLEALDYRSKAARCAYDFQSSEVGMKVSWYHSKNKVEKTQRTRANVRQERLNACLYLEQPKISTDVFEQALLRAGQMDISAIGQGSASVSTEAEEAVQSLASQRVGWVSRLSAPQAVPLLVKKLVPLVDSVLACGRAKEVDLTAQFLTWDKRVRHLNHGVGIQAIGEAQIRRIQH